MCIYSLLEIISLESVLFGSSLEDEEMCTHSLLEPLCMVSVLLGSSVEDEQMSTHSPLELLLMLWSPMVKTLWWMLEPIIVGGSPRHPGGSPKQVWGGRSWPSHGPPCYSRNKLTFGIVLHK